MRIAVTGSIATDHLMVFPGSFTDQLIADKLDKISLSFLVDGLQVRRGGVAANISFGLGQLGLTPRLVGAVGADFAEYRVWLKEHGVDTDSVHVSDFRQTARFICLTDQEMNQIAAFYAGAMSESREIDLAELGEVDLVLVSPNDPEAMLRHTRQCQELGIPFAADPSQQLATLDAESVRTLVDGAMWLFTNEYEAALLLERTGWQRSDVLARVGHWVTTLGADGARIDRAGEEPVVVPAVPTGRTIDPTGVGDGFRAGFLAAISWGLTPRVAAQLGCALATEVLETVGPQEYTLASDGLVAVVGATYGAGSAQALSPHLSAG